MSKILAEKDTPEGFTVRMLMSQGNSLAEARIALERATILYDTMAKQYGLMPVAQIEAALGDH